ncbi:MAG TPA: hypothetical protein VH640_06375, partial [Bryobacteraceae bacterium]
AAVVSPSPALLVSFPSGTLSGQTLTFNSPASLGLFNGSTSITSGSLTLNVTNFQQVGSAVTGTLSINSTSGSITGSSTYQP